MTNSGAPGLLRSRFARDFAVLVGSGAVVAGLLLLGAQPASASCAMCPDDLGSDPSTPVLVVLPASGAIPAEVPCLVDLGYRAVPVPGLVGAVGMVVLAGDRALCLEELAVAPVPAPV